MGYGIAEWMDGQLEELRGIKIENGIMSVRRNRGSRCKGKF